MNKQFDLFQKMKIKEVCENISRMTYAYINPDTKQPTIVPSKHYKDILDQPVEVLVNDQVKKQFLNIMFKQMKTLKEEEPILYLIRKRLQTISVYSCSKQRLWISKDKYLGNIPKTLSYQKSW